MKFSPKTKFQKFAVMAGVLLASGSVWALNTSLVSAAGGSIYLTSSSPSVTNGATFTVSVRVAPGGTADTVTPSVSYDAAKLSLTGVNCAGTVFYIPAGGCPTSGNPLAIIAADLAPPIPSDTLVATLTFQALAGSGTTAISVAGGIYSSDVPQAGVTTTGVNITLTTPAAPTPTCADSGKTGTYPNCVTPAPSTGGSTGTSGGAKTPTTTTPAPTKTTTPTTTPTPTVSTTTADNTATVTTKDLKFTEATFTATSKSPTQAYIQFGTSQNALTSQTPLSDSGTTHKITIDPSQLLPGQTYYYVVVSKAADGTLTQTSVDSFTLNGLTIRVGVFDKNHNPLKKKAVTLHSTPMTATTDDTGYANFTNVIPGQHQVQYASNGKTYTKQISVDNNVQAATQTTAVQKVAVVYDLTNSSSLASARWVVLGLLLVVVIVAVVLFSQSKIKFAVPGGKPRSMAPIVVGGKTTAHSTPSATSVAPTSTETSERLNSIPVPDKPAPGSTVAPVADERKKF